MEGNDFKKQGIYDYDDGKLVFSIRYCGMKTEESIVPLNGVLFGEILHKEYGQMMEMAGGSYVIAMTSIADSKEAFEALYQAMETIDNRLIYLPITADTTVYKMLPDYGMGIDKALDRAHENVLVSEAEGRISGEFIYVYPPGIPIIAPGEVVSKDIIREIKKSIEKGLNIKGVVQGEENYLSVIKEDR